MPYRHRKLTLVKGTANARADVLVQPVPAPRVRELNTLKAIDLTEFNSRAEQAFVELVAAFVQECSQPPRVREVLAEAAFELNISIETAKRYLLKHSARRAEFAITGGVVTLREGAK